LSTLVAGFGANKANTTNRRERISIFIEIQLGIHDKILIMHASSRGLCNASRLSLRGSNWKGTKIAFAGPCLACRYLSKTARQPVQPADDPSFVSVVDNPPNLIRTGKRHGIGLIILGMELPSRKHLMLTLDQH